MQEEFDYIVGINCKTAIEGNQDYEEYNISNCCVFNALLDTIEKYADDLLEDFIELPDVVEIGLFIDHEDTEEEYNMGALIKFENTTVEKIYDGFDFFNETQELSYTFDWWWIYMPDMENDN